MFQTIDHFKSVNDTYGHAGGDSVLVAVADALKHRARETDIVARLGGEEFCFLAVNPQPQSVGDVFDSVRKAVEDLSVDLEDGRTVKVTTSIGVCSDAGGTMDQMMQFADEALYKAKEEGRNRVILHKD